jgi:hypothetical protein
MSGQITGPSGQGAGITDLRQVYKKKTSSSAYLISTRSYENNSKYNKLATLLKSCKGRESKHQALLSKLFPIE